MVTVPELDFSVRPGRPGIEVALEEIGEVRESDLALLASERKVATPAIKELRDRHHALARVLASGVSHTEASVITGYSQSRISILLADPSFRGLMASYKELNLEVHADFVERTNVLALSAVNRLQEIVEDEETPPSATTTLEIAKFAADRTGHAVVQKNMNLNVNLGTGDRLAAARARLRALTAPPMAEAGVIDAEFSSETPVDD